MLWLRIWFSIRRRTHTITKNITPKPKKQKWSFRQIIENWVWDSNAAQDNLHLQFLTNFTRRKKSTGGLELFPCRKWGYKNRNWAHELHIVRWEPRVMQLKTQQKSHSHSLTYPLAGGAHCHHHYTTQGNVVREDYRLVLTCIIMTTRYI